MSRPKQSYPKNCKAAKTDEYYKWLLNNVGSWSDDDRNTALHNGGKWGLSTNQGMSNGDILNEINNCLCRYATSESERSACACQKSMNMISTTLIKNQELVDRNRSKLTGFSNSIKEYNTKLADWKARRGAKRIELSGFKKKRGCNEGCLSGETRDRYSSNVCPWAWQKKSYCVYSDKGLEDQLALWEVGNPKPVYPTDNQLEAPSNIQANITCCSQNIENIKAKGGNVTIKDISQECGGNVINAKSGGGGDKEGSGLGWWIFGGGSGGSSSSSCCSCIIILLLLLLL